MKVVLCGQKADLDSYLKVVKVNINRFERKYRKIGYVVKQGEELVVVKSWKLKEEEKFFIKDKEVEKERLYIKNGLKMIEL